MNTIEQKMEDLFRLEPSGCQNYISNNTMVQYPIANQSIEPVRLDLYQDINITDPATFNKTEIMVNTNTTFNFTKTL